jgi:hypothetical protein
MRCDYDVSIWINYHSTTDPDSLRCNYAIHVDSSDTNYAAVNISWITSCSITSSGDLECISYSFSQRFRTDFSHYVNALAKHIARVISNPTSDLDVGIGFLIARIASQVNYVTYDPVWVEFADRGVSKLINYSDVALDYWILILLRRHIADDAYSKVNYFMFRRDLARNKCFIGHVL